jgi:hypothetical protein
MKEEIKRAVKDHETWLKVWKLVEKLDGEIRYDSTKYSALAADSSALAKLVRPAVLRSQEELNVALLDEC